LILPKEYPRSSIRLYSDAASLASSDRFFTFLLSRWL